MTEFQPNLKIARVVTMNFWYLMRNNSYLTSSLRFSRCWKTSPIRVDVRAFSDRLFCATHATAHHTSSENKCEWENTPTPTSMSFAVHCGLPQFHPAPGTFLRQPPPPPPPPRERITSQRTLNRKNRTKSSEMEKQRA